MKEVESLLLQARSEGRSTEEVLDDLDNWRPVDVVEVAAAAGAGAEVLDETPVGRSWFSRTWLRENALDPVECAVLAVRGGSMEPTLPDGCSILVDRNRRVLQTNRIYVLRTCDGLVVKRVLWVNGWLIFSDNPSWLPVPLEEDTDVVGEVRWTSRTL